MNTSPGRSLRNFELDKVKIFIKDVGLPFNRAPEALGVKSTDFMNWWAGNDPKLIKYRELISLSQFLNIDENTIIDGSYDKQFVRSLLFVDPQTLPEKYSLNQFSYMRTSAHIMKFLTLTRGQHFSDLIMRKLNISPAIYGDLNNRISLNYFVDLLEVLAGYGLMQDELDNLACVMFLSLSDTPLGEKFKKATNYYDCYEIVANNVHLFDSNFVYTFDLDRKKIQLRSFLQYENHAQID